MPTTRVDVSFADLRRYVIAMWHYGMELKSPNLTFSHGNVGNEFIALANKLDALVSDSEPNQTMAIMSVEKFEELRQSDRDDRNRQFDTIREWQKFAHNLGKLLEMQGTTDDYLNSVNSLISKVGTLEHIKDKQTREILRLEGLIVTRNRRDKARFSDLERATEKVLTPRKPGKDRKRKAERRK